MGWVSLTKRVEFAASHRYYNRQWSETENRRIFGACANPYGHGHNYLLEVTVGGEVDPVDDKAPEVAGTLLGIKGQYLILDSGVINLRKFTGYEVAVGA